MEKVLTVFLFHTLPVQMYQLYITVYCEVFVKFTLLICDICKAFEIQKAVFL